MREEDYEKKEKKKKKKKNETKLLLSWRNILRIECAQVLLLILKPGPKKQKNPGN